MRSAARLEALGRVDVVCFDKTGTLTENRLRVVRRRYALERDTTTAATTTRCSPSPRGRGDAADAQVHEADRAVVASVTGSGDAASGRARRCLPFTAGRGYSAGVRAGRLASRARRKWCSRAAAPGHRGRGGAERVERLAAEGLRVIAVAERDRVVPPTCPGSGLDNSADVDLDDAAHDLVRAG